MACIGSLLTQSIKTFFLAENDEDFSKKSSYSTMKAPEYSTRDHLRVHLTLKNRSDVSLFPSSTSSPLHRPHI
ncbi:Hypothetical protein FKW44_007121 [Caligus rogercresseyi]|uniref:Uncharacterized protein n=1 Tax=Caligus rogercresseyi TaxID=217165 RepID=A0A7T8QTB3_CALRO|nr:Hypothetical protein FKW44_007121 [Caligus rogercresseyi]